LKNLRIGSKTVGKHPLIVGVVTSLAAMSRVLRRKIRPFDIIEVRLDLMKTGADKLAPFLRRMETAGTPVLLTIRSRREKGAWRGSEQERNDLYAALMPFGRGDSKSSFQGALQERASRRSCGDRIFS
jgi:3-dehydroquinate dehydratase